MSAPTPTLSSFMATMGARGPGTARLYCRLYPESEEAVRAGWAREHRIYNVRAGRMGGRIMTGYMLKAHRPRTPKIRVGF